MRRILVDHARRRGFSKRGGKALRVPLDEVPTAGKRRKSWVFRWTLRSVIGGSPELSETTWGTGGHAG
ncbi:MAG: hypothetical protein HYZ57_13285 [Acidobacteria bacterium]|nr:hypothetical protein [Acidobacteriota bacterium]